HAALPILLGTTAWPLAAKKSRNAWRMSALLFIAWESCRGLAPPVAGCSEAEGIFRHGNIAENMQMQVEHGLAGAGAVVDDQPEGIADAGGGGDLAGGGHQVAEQRPVVVAGIHQPGDGFSGDQQQMGGSLGGDVADGETELVFVEDLARDLAIDDAGKYRLFCHLVLLGAVAGTAGMFRNGGWRRA